MGSFDGFLNANAQLDIQPLDAKSRLDLTKSGNNIVIIDGATASDKKLMKEVMAAGNAVIFINDPSVVEQLEDAPTRLNAQSTYENGQRYSSNVFGYYQPLSGPSASFYSGESDPIKAAVLAQEWAADAIAQNAELQRENLMQAGEYELQSPHPAYSEKHTRTYSYTDPDGNYKFNARTSYYWLADDGDDTKDFWVAELKGELIPMLGDGTSAMHSHTLHTKLNVNAYDPSFYISDYQPTASSGGLNVAIDFEGVGWSYDATSMTVTNHSDSSLGIASWEHKFPQFGHIISKNTAVMAPGVEFVTTNGDGSEQVWNQVYETQVAAFSTLIKTEKVAVHFGAFGAQELHNKASIRNKVSDECLTVRNDGTGIVIPTLCIGFETQYFDIDVRVEESEDHHSIDEIYHMFKQEGKCLKIGSENVTMVTCDTSDNQQMIKIEHFDGDWHQLRHKGNKCMRLRTSGTWFPVKKLKEWVCLTSDSFKFRFRN